MVWVVGIGKGEKKAVKKELKGKRSDGREGPNTRRK
jgi:hypothetical protein